MGEEPPLLEFASAEWLSGLDQIFQGLATARPEHVFPVACEVYLNVPPHLARDGSSTIAWTRHAGDGKARLSLDECPEVESDVKYVGDYATLRVLARFVVTEDSAPEFRALVDESIKAGGLTVICDKRDLTLAPDYTAHNLIARMTR